MAAKDDAITKVNDFNFSSAVGVWTNIAKLDMASGLLARIEDPNKVDQQSTSLCGPAAFVRSLIKEDPVAYAQFGIDLWTSGKAKVKSLSIKASDPFRKVAKPDSINEADWVVLGSMRDDDNWVFTYKGTNSWYDNMKAICLPHSMADWFRKAGYTDVKNETNLVVTKDWSDAKAASKLFDGGYTVCLFINAQMLKADTQENFSFTADHWVGLTSSITSTTILEDPAAQVSLSVYTWGATQKVPVDASKPLHPKTFLRNFYGYVAGKPS